jgi:hypothetical protein
MFEVHLIDSGSNQQGEVDLRQALWPSGHDVWLDEDDEGRRFLAVRIRCRQPAQELEKLMRQAHLSGCFVPLGRG